MARLDLETIKARIRALRAMTQENGCTEHEALSAAALASRILAEHGLTLEEVESIRLSQSVGDAVEDARFTPSTREVVFCLVAIARHFDCEVWSNGIHSFTLFGLPQDVFAAQTLSEIVCDAMEVAWDDYKTHKRREPVGWRDNPVQHARIREAFMGAMGTKIARRLVATKSAPRAPPNSKALVLAKHDIVRRAMVERGIHLGQSKPITFVDDFHASVAGSSAGGRVDLSNPFKVRPGKS